MLGPTVNVICSCRSELAKMLIYCPNLRANVKLLSAPSGYLQAVSLYHHGHKETSISEYLSKLVGIWVLLSGKERMKISGYDSIILNYFQ